MATKVMVGRNGVPGKDAGVGAPNQTLYCTNLAEKINKEDLRRALYMLFSTYGPVLDVVAMRGNSRRGQAHVVFRDIQASTQAMRALQGFDLFGKEMKMVYGKGQSHVIDKLRGTFEVPTVQASASETTELQKSIFNAPPSSIPARPIETNTTKASDADQQAAPHGVKRQREPEVEEDEDSDGEAPMDEDDEEDAPMEDSDDD